MRTVSSTSPGGSSPPRSPPRSRSATGVSPRWKPRCNACSAAARGRELRCDEDGAVRGGDGRLARHGRALDGALRRASHTHAANACAAFTLSLAELGFIGWICQPVETIASAQRSRRPRTSEPRSPSAPRGRAYRHLRLAVDRLRRGGRRCGANGDERSSEPTFSRNQPDTDWGIAARLRALTVVIRGKELGIELEGRHRRISIRHGAGHQLDGCVVDYDQLGVVIVDEEPLAIVLVPLVEASMPVGAGQLECAARSKVLVVREMSFWPI